MFWLLQDILMDSSQTIAVCIKLTISVSGLAYDALSAL